MKTPHKYESSLDFDEVWSHSFVSFSFLLFNIPFISELTFSLDARGFSTYGIVPLSANLSGNAFIELRYSTITKLFLLAARCNGVYPSFVLLSIFAPEEHRCSTISK